MYNYKKKKEFYISTFKLCTINQIALFINVEQCFVVLKYSDNRMSDALILHANKKVESAAYKSYYKTIFMFYILSNTVVLVKLKLTKSSFLTLSSNEFFRMFRFHFLNYRFIYYSSGIEFKSRSF